MAGTILPRSYAGQFNVMVVADQDTYPDLETFAAGTRDDLQVFDALRQPSREPAWAVKRQAVGMDEIPMEPDLVTEPRLIAVLDELTKREPLFHRRELVNSRETFERETADDFWETGASGRRYSREYVWATLRQRYESTHVDEFVADQWETRDFHLREIAPETYLLTYTLWGQNDRLTRRLTVWQGSGADGWTALYHQGTTAS